MPINTAVLALVLIFIPGILCYGVVASLASKRTRDNTTVFLQIFMYGVASYMALAAVNALYPAMTGRLGVNLDDIALLNPSAIDKSGIKAAPIGVASVIGVILGLVVTLNSNHGLLIRLCRLIRITRRFSDPDVWSLLLTSYDTDNWVTVRHKERGHIYQGYVRSFSAGEKEREMVLELVQVFSLDTAEKVGEIPILYLAFKKDDLVLEFGANPKSVGRSRGDE
nr:DUF6338 family protein [uncultured Rhodopila sp.]